MVRRISGKYKASTVSHLKSSNNDIIDVKEICNTSAKQFAFNSNLIIIVIGLIVTDFNTNDNYSYNDVSDDELKQAIQYCLSR